MGCLQTKDAGRSPHSLDTREAVALAAETSFTVSEVEALHDLFRKISNSIVKDNLISKEEFHVALFRNKKKQNLFVDRVFDLFDQKQNGVIEFGEFVRSLSVFHPDAPEEQKVAFAFKLYDLRQTGFIERNETFDQADTKGDGRIDQEEWTAFAKDNPYVLRNMTLPYLKDITMVFPSFVVHSEISEADMAA
ncbi:unnamed protein product [Urochloa humidicola]